MKNSEQIQIAIKKSDRLSEIKSRFTSLFPYLKLEFFRKPHKVNEPSEKKLMIEEDAKLDQTGLTKEGHLAIDNTMTVGKVESILRDEFGLYAHVFRKSGNIWLETSSTDNMTLTEQNQLGEEKTIPPEPPDLSDIDYD